MRWWKQCNKCNTWLFIQISGSHTVGGVTKNAPNERTINTDSQKDMIVIGTNISGYKKIDSIATDGSSVTLSDSGTTVATQMKMYSCINQED